MKKIYIHNIDNHIVDNIEKVHISDLQTIPNGSCAMVICDCLDSLSFQDRLEATQHILKKIAKGGSVTFKFISLKLFAKYVMNDKLDIGQINQVLYHSRSMYDENMFTNVLSSHTNFVIKENTYNNLIRQVVLERQ